MATLIANKTTRSTRRLEVVTAVVYETAEGWVAQNATHNPSVAITIMARLYT